MVVRASVAAMVIAVLLVILCVSCFFLCGVQLLHLGDSPFDGQIPHANEQRAQLADHGVRSAAAATTPLRRLLSHRNSP